ncbi:putative outer membrane lipoprotein-sorting protein LolA [Candidatus Kuenenia stuttgartiensis]|jgi:outer membrane lipoprotein-sorting protein|nr:outer membrane lipoprotein carrier protein LolA [Candidatus Kuenenia stuttgartiensis]MBE7548759.1 outer membrane lipoprotein carrier protein LolA [Planctomycetia bacterium]MCZ7622262.1 outer membrane lipoprotein carrier protein LolA [Candidatus Kuenenia sp.]MBW7942508.1 outer membrane lipoprotein carrier protein LolA [Candidatus Kuenenia stuttgartiensis]MCL4727740.1 outer membrane lipoprotein carrier protein LolA [Candidatus Kuenenia stuttgartiensis]QII11156.1 putative outer membrane lipopr
MLVIKNISVCFFLAILSIGFVFIIPGNVSCETLPSESSETNHNVFERFLELTQNNHSIIAKIHQEKHLSLLGKKVHIYGTLTMKKPNMLRWDINKPDKSIIAIDGKDMIVYHPEAKEAQIYSVSGNFTARNTMRFFSEILSGSLEEMEKKFTLEISREEDGISFHLTPKSKMARRYLSHIVIHYDKDSSIPSGIGMFTPKGDKIITRLSEVKINPEISADIFTIKLPADVLITNRRDTHDGLVE